jgi:hypothetical protein
LGTKKSEDAKMITPQRFSLNATAGSSAAAPTAPGARDSGFAPLGGGQLHRVLPSRGAPAQLALPLNAPLEPRQQRLRTG